jgi:hypothetical protein
MTTEHPAATEHLPIFITAPGSPDVLMNIMGAFLIGMILLTGVVFFRLHTLPERIAHKSQKLQFEIVAVLGLLSLLTHQHAFWVAGLLLAFVDLPDFSTPIGRIATSLEHMAGKKREPDPGEEPWEDTSVLAPDEPPLKLSVQPQADTQANLSPGSLSSGKASSAKTSSAKASSAMPSVPHEQKA